MTKTFRPRSVLEPQLKRNLQDSSKQYSFEILIALLKRYTQFGEGVAQYQTLRFEDNLHTINPSMEVGW